MNIYSIALFLHIVGALVFFVVLSLEWIGLSQIRSAKIREEADAILGIVKWSIKNVLLAAQLRVLVKNNLLFQGFFRRFFPVSPERILIV